MKILKFETQAEWLSGRLGKLTGSKVKDVVVKRGTGRKIGFYELIADQLLSPDAEPENPMDRGHRLEPEALDRYEQKTGEKLDRSLVMWVREDDENVAVSPDGSVEGSNNTKAVEAKCLSSARHIEAYITKQVPDEYHYQKLQYFLVNDKLETLTFAFYDPRLRVVDFFTIEITRADVLAELEELMVYERQLLADVQTEVNKILTF